MQEYIEKPPTVEKAKELVDPEYHRLLDMGEEAAKKYRQDILVPTQDFLRWIHSKLRDAFEEDIELGGHVEYVVATARAWKTSVRDKCKIVLPVNTITSSNTSSTPYKNFMWDDKSLYAVCDDLLYGLPNACGIWHSHPDDSVPSCGDLKLKYSIGMPPTKFIATMYPEYEWLLNIAYTEVPDLLLTGGTANFAILYHYVPFVVLPLSVRTSEIGSVPLLYWAKEHAGGAAYDYYAYGIVNELLAAERCPEVAKEMYCYAFWVEEVESKIDLERYYEIIPYGGERLG